MWLNGKLLHHSSLDRGLQFGDGHFTTLVIRQGQLEFWQQHWQRLVCANDRLAMPPLEHDKLLNLVTNIAVEQPNAVVKIIITRGYSERGYGTTATEPSNCYVTTAPLATWSNTPLQVDLAKLTLAEQPYLAGLKTLNRLEQVLLAQEKQARQLDDLLVCDSQGHLVEATSSNLFWYDGKQWFYPVLDRAGIVGIMQQQIVTHVLPQAQPCRAQFEQIAAAKQAFLCNTVLGPRPIAKIGEQVLAQQELPEVVYQWYLNVLSKPL